MKILKKMCLIFMALFILLPMVSACNEETFDTVPWVECKEPEDEIINKMTTSKNKMIKVISLPIEYNTKTTYNFMNLTSGEDSKKEIRDEVKTVIDNEIGLAQVTKQRFVNNTKQEDYLDTYSKDNGKGKGFHYIKSEIINPENSQSTINYEREEYKRSENSFVTILEEVILPIFQDEISKIETKVFQGVTYYKLTAQAESFDKGLGAVNNRFVGKKDLLTSPELFSIMSKDDNVISFNYTFGLNEEEYLVYSKVCYEVEKAFGNILHNIDRYLVVTSETSLVNYGDNVEKLTELDDRGLYTAFSFVNAAKNQNRDSYIIYKEIGEGVDYTKITLWNRHDEAHKNEISFIEETIVSGSRNSSRYCYAEPTVNGGYDVYEMISASQCKKIENNFLFLNIDYTLPHMPSSNNHAQGKYYFGNNEKTITIKVSNDKVSSVMQNGEAEIFIDSYGEGKPRGDMPDMAGHEKLPETPVE